MLEKPVAQSQHVVEAIEDLLVVGDRDDGGALLQRDPPQEVHDDPGALGIECRGRLVGEDDARMIGERAGATNRQDAPPTTATQSPVTAKA